MVIGAKTEARLWENAGPFWLESLAAVGSSNRALEVDESDEVATLQIAESVEFWDKKLGSSRSV